MCQRRSAVSSCRGLLDSRLREDFFLSPPFLFARFDFLESRVFESSMSTSQDQRVSATDYLYKHGIPSLLEDLTADLARTKPADPLGHLIALLENRRNQGASSGQHTIVFVLGGPGSGKGTLCSRLLDGTFRTKLVHLSAGDLLREEQSRPESQYGQLIQSYIAEGKIVPKEVTIGLLQRQIEQRKEPCTFLIDGFPRAMDQAVAFEDSVQKCKFVLFLDCDEATMEARLLRRGETSGRIDDNAETIRKRFHTYVGQTMPVIEYFERDNRVRKVSATQTPDQVYAAVKSLFQ
eukprot:ANDGO_03419.mRNA.1 Uridylate kinase